MKSMPLVSTALLVVAYALPWMVVPTVSGLTVSAYDLAEWASIHPSVRADTLLLTPLLLRLPLVCLAMWFATQPTSRWLRAVVIVLLAIASLPPLEFFTVSRSDANYQQQFVLALIALIGGWLMLALSALQSRYLPRISPVVLRLIAALALIIAALVGVWGMLRAHMLFREFALDPQAGMGGVLFVLVAVIAVGDWLARKHAA